MSDIKTLTVLVLLKPASGRAVTTETTTAKRVKDLAPPRRAAAELRKFFVERGTEVGPMVGTSFAITVPIDRVHAVLGEEVDGAFPACVLPSSLAPAVEAIVRDRPMEFGPVSFQ